ncbi:BAHD acyltransferase At5g47980-like [Coffea eugenioides]|uniref:BAHD acyltransferase At5g47980-like n=1 Tax=Coffea eugenioides TaxID=49369 RepID=UPI000F60BFEA|nr:BAHD acyltransferase At5g47980-like [Coffea eugenioides]
MVIDMTTISVFLKCWAAISRGSQDDQSPGHPYPRAPAISDLKVKGSSKRVPDPTSVEVVSSFIWKHAMAAAKVVKGFQQPSVIFHAADLRRRMVPPLPEYSAGNIGSPIVAEYEKIDELEVKFGRLVKILRLAKEKNKDEFVPKLLSSGGFDMMIKFLEDWGEKCSNKDLNTYQFSSWCKIGLNEVDFGWGKPIWTSLVGGTEVESMYKNFVVLVDGSDGGIEAWLILEQKEMAVLENDGEFLAYASPNPGIIIS